MFIFGQTIARKNHLIRPFSATILGPFVELRSIECSKMASYIKEIILRSKRVNIKVGFLIDFQILEFNKECLGGHEASKRERNYYYKNHRQRKPTNNNLLKRSNFRAIIAIIFSD